MSFHIGFTLMLPLIWQVPKGFPYFSVDFGLQGGFAHVIEDEKDFPFYFGRVSSLVHVLSIKLLLHHENLNFV